MSGERRAVIEDVLTDFGFRLRWSIYDYKAEVEVFLIVGREQDGTALFEGKGSKGPCENMTTDIAGAEPYLEGAIKWDGCSHLEIHETHFCGASSYQEHVDLLRCLWVRAFELMGREPEDDWAEARARAADARDEESGR